MWIEITVSIWFPNFRKDQPVRTPTEPSGAERRRAVRHPCSFRTSCQPISLMEAIGVPVHVRDISTGGIGLVSRSPVTPGTFFAIELQNTNGGPSLRLRARIIHSTRQDERSWLLGCIFTRELSQDELSTLL
jgi:hypothetical protein